MRVKSSLAKQSYSLVHMKIQGKGESNVTNNMVWILIGIIIIVLALLVFLDWFNKDEEFEKIPGPKGIFLFHNALDFLMDPVKLFYFFRQLANKYKYLFKIKFGMVKCVVIYNPEDVEIVLSGIKNTSKGFLYRFLEPWLKDGLLLSDGLKWQHRRKILTPTFHFNILRHFLSILEENSLQLIDQLKIETNKPKTNISAIVTDYTLKSICETAMGMKLDPDSSDDGRRYKEGIYSLGQLLVYRSQRLWMFFDWIYNLTETGKKQQKVLNLLRTFRDKVINNRRDTCNYQNLGEYLKVENDERIYDDNVYGKKKFAMLDLLLQAEKMGTIDAEGIGEEVDTFMFEGHDTTSTALQFLLMALANNPEVQDKAIEECDMIFGTSERLATMKDLRQMKYLECCIKESLRLYPPVYFIMRKFSHTTQLTNYEVAAGTDCSILVYDLHRRDDQFVEPLVFRPERFLGEPTWHPFSYVPFSAGPRNCIGQKFAMMEMKLAASAILRRYRLLPVTRPQDLIFITDFILRPKDPIYVKLQSRI